MTRQVTTTAIQAAARQGTATVVVKFGSSVLRSEADLPTAVHQIYRHVRRGERVVAVVSAIGDATDRLIEQGRAWSADCDERVSASLLATGEATSAALLAHALDRVGLAVRVLPAEQAGLRTDGPVLDAEPVTLDRDAFERAFEHAAVSIVPGFVGVDRREHHTTLFGRGGSDLTAAFIAGELGADRCILQKDVDGVYTSDPNRAGSAARRYATLSWDTALAVAGRLVQTKAIEYARDRGLAISVRAFGATGETTIGPYETSYHTSDRMGRRLRVGLLGLGTVGGGVCRRLQAYPEHFELVRVAVRSVDRRRQEVLVPEQLTQDANAVVDGGGCDVIVDLRADVDDPLPLLERALATGSSVVTACKQTMADHGDRLREVARAHGARMHASASIGGGLPVVESVEHGIARHGRVVAFEGVLNGTANFVLERLVAGDSLGDAVAEAQRLGFAEADPGRDLSGLDSWQKARILARAAFGADLPGEDAAVTGVDAVDAALLDRIRSDGLGLKLVASARIADGEIVANVGVRTVDPTSILARPRREQNVVVLHHENGVESVVFGRGAGRWPTTESVFADLLDELHARRDASAACASTTPNSPGGELEVA